VKAASARPGPARKAGRPAPFPRQVLAAAIETFFQTRGLALWVVCAIGGALALAAGARLPRPAGDGGSLSSLLLHGILTLLLTAAALAAGARGLAGDRTAGLRDLFGSMPILAPAFFLGRFCGLAVRFAAAVLLLAALGGLLLAALPGSGTFQKTTEPSRFFAGGTERDPGAVVRLPPDGTRARWIFEGEGPAAGGTPGCALRFFFRVRHPRDEAFQNTLPVRVEVLSKGRQVLAEDLTLSLRKEFTLPLPGLPRDETEVLLSVRGGVNFLETGATQCRLLRGAAGPVAAMTAAALSFVPVLLTGLALALFFSSFVSEPTALLAAAVLVLITLASPSLQKDLSLVAAGSGPGRGAAADAAVDDDGGGAGQYILRKGAAIAGRAMAVFPDPTAGGGARPLSRRECPSASDILLPWKEALPRLAAILLLGCLIASWRRP